MTHDLVSAPITGNHTIFLSGPPGSGKTTLAVQRLHHLLQRQVPAEQILVLVPQRTLAEPYYAALRSPKLPAGGLVDPVTIGGLARRTLDLFWPLVAEPAGFQQPDRQPRFLTLETAQYVMDHVAESYLARGAFDGIAIPRSRLVSQIIDNLNKAAAVGFPVSDISARLKAAWEGDSARLRIYDQVQDLAQVFRRTCLARNLLDWSLQIHVFWHYLLPLPELQRYLLGGYRHLIVDNTEEDIPAAHDLLKRWLPLCESALVIHDTDGGYRIFLGADPVGALELSGLCRERFVLGESHVSSPQTSALGAEMAASFLDRPAAPHDRKATKDLARQALVVPLEPLRFHPQILDWVSQEISRLVMEEKMPPGEIAVLAPFLSDALRFSLSERLERYHIAVRTHRPSRPLREEPAARCLLTLAKLAHPHWRQPPPTADVSDALVQAVQDMDPVRAHLLTGIVYRVREGQPALTPFHQIVPETQERISFLLGGRYDELRSWLQARAGAAADQSDDGETLDVFLSRLFGEVLSQPGFGFHRDYDAGAFAATLIESIQKFRRTLPLLEAQSPDALSGASDPDSGLQPGAAPLPPPPSDTGREYLQMVERGVVAAQYLASWQVRPGDAVLLVPAYTFLMMNQPVTVQFWLDANSPAWSERIHQPLTHPHVLRRDWPQDRTWADEDEVRAQNESLGRLVMGLGRRCRRTVYLAYGELNERGYEQQGPLLHAVHRLLQNPGGDS
jgi:hypothetical protein